MDLENIKECPNIRVGLTGAKGCEFQSMPGGLTLAKDVEIGLNFHWNRKIDMMFPGYIEHNDPRCQGVPVNIINLETYLTSVISSEMSKDAPLEFLKAHAVISRSWALGKIDNSHIGNTHHPHPNNLSGSQDLCRKTDSLISPDAHSNNVTEIVQWEDTEAHTGFDVCADDHCQRYQGIADVNENVSRAVKETEGVVLTYDGDLVDARFSKCCGGGTEQFSSAWQNRNFAYLSPVRCDFCNLANLDENCKNMIFHSVLKDYDQEIVNPYSWQVIVTKAEVEKNLLDKFGVNIGNIITVHPLERGVSGRIVRLHIIGTNGEVVIGKELMIRRLFSASHLYSSNFEICSIDDGQSFILTGHGWGHGVGLCQIGAARMAYEGYDFESILKYYYKYSGLKKIY